MCLDPSKDFFSFRHWSIDYVSFCGRYSGTGYSQQNNSSIEKKKKKKKNVVRNSFFLSESAKDLFLSLIIIWERERERERERFGRNRIYLKIIFLKLK